MVRMVWVLSLFLLSSCMTPTDNENLEIQIIDEGLQIAISKKLTKFKINYQA